MIRDQEDVSEEDIIWDIDREINETGFDVFESLQINEHRLSFLNTLDSLLKKRTWEYFMKEHYKNILKQEDEGDKWVNEYDDQLLFQLGTDLLVCCGMSETSTFVK